VNWLWLIPAGAALALVVGRPALARGLPAPTLGWLLALAPAAALAGIVGDLLRAPITASLPGLHWGFAPATLHLDYLSGLFAVLVTGIGALAVIYAGYYFKGDAGAWRFFTYLLLFMTAMLGVVLAGDLITLFVFWEATSITSFLLIGYKYDDPAARRGALQSLLITGGGGVALLIGLAGLAVVAGGTDFATVLAAGNVVREHAWYPVVLALIALGAFSKSAQVPFHFWLPDGMTAPTPASAFLHSATMVKAGVYLLARLHPTLGGTDLWFWLLSAFGLVTMITGAWMGLRQHDLKGLLAYSTISQLGALVLLLGQDTPIAFKAVVISIAAHALYKSALFLIAGIVDHETGTRDLRRLSHMARAMPVTCAVATIAALSMAGLPPMFGFLAKETLLATAVHPNVPGIVAPVLTAGAVLAGAFLFVQAWLFVWEVFFDPPREPQITGHDPSWGMWLMPAIPAAISLAIGLLPEPAWLATFFAGAAEVAAGEPVKVSLAVWTGINIPLGLSALAVTTGLVMLWTHRRWRPVLERSEGLLACRRIYDWGLQAMDGAAWLVTRAQQGRLRHYLTIMLLALLALIVRYGALTWPVASATGINWLEVVVLVVALATTLATVFLRRDLPAILALGGSGLAVAVLFALVPAPDVALVQVVVDILLTVLLVLALLRVPRPARAAAETVTYRQSRPGLLRDVVVAGLAGLVVMVVCVGMLSSRPRESQVKAFYEASAKPLTGAKDIVGAILVDFRSFDTLIEIAVFGFAGLAALTLLALGKTGKPRALSAERSPLMRSLASVIIPLTLVIGAVQVIYGHDQPGDGFSAGVVISIGVAYAWLVFGPVELRQKLPWLRPAVLVGAGLLLVLASATSALFWGREFFAPVDFGAWLNLPLPAGVALTTSFLFELAICITVVGGAAAMLLALGGEEA
jgi:multicomponent K+:H+ antiporter subunit A